MEHEDHCEGIKVDFGDQNSNFEEEMDKRLPTPKIKELSTTIYVDTDHGHDRVTERSIPSLILFVGTSPLQWEFKQQVAVQTATSGAEFIA
mmetsp:Transcript_17286/g.24418  ORF Transcript_17286/g.24418 Transcript_17286/m.24418 type:complete len:91 (+) Transcript_17286:743-1015(+)